MSAKELYHSIRRWINLCWLFITEDMWRISQNEVTGMRRTGISIAKTIAISFRRFNDNQISRKASALTYNSLLAIVPLLALLFSIANGFGLQNIVQSQLFDYFPAQQEALNQALIFVDSYLQQTQDGVVLGIGVIFLLMSVVGLLNNIENCFNDIWQIHRNRSYYRKITDYFALFIILPILITTSAGLSIFVSAYFNNTSYFKYLAPIYRYLIEVAPLIVTWIFFTVLYIMVPNTKVKFKHALLAGIIAGSLFQLFQYIYISGQIWVTKNNAIYGSFAFLPLLMLWIQGSWVICLFGVTLSYSAQNIRNYEFEQDTQTISNRYRQFITLIITTVIVKRFTLREKPLTVEEISSLCCTPISLTHQIVEKLSDVGIINETPTTDERVMAYQPAIDVQQLSVGYLFERLNLHGSENFHIDTQNTFNAPWLELTKLHQIVHDKSNHILIKNIDIPIAL